jgi:hypothetical protein
MVDSVERQDHVRQRNHNQLANCHELPPGKAHDHLQGTHHWVEAHGLLRGESVAHDKKTVHLQDMPDREKARARRAGKGG